MPPLTKAVVLEYAKGQFGSEPEYLWASDPEAAVLRRADNQKWYALLMPAARERLGLPGEGKIEVLGLKCGPIVNGSLRGKPGILPAYHMNKANWVTLCLDGTVSQEEGFPLLALSYSLAGPKPGRKAAAAQKKPPAPPKHTDDW